MMACGVQVFVAMEKEKELKDLRVRYAATQKALDVMGARILELEGALFGDNEPGQDECPYCGQPAEPCAERHAMGRSCV